MMTFIKYLADKNMRINFNKREALHSYNASLLLKFHSDSEKKPEIVAYLQRKVSVD